MTAPVVLFVYKRPDHTMRVVEALRANPPAADSDLYVFSDAPRSEADRPGVEEVRRRLTGITGFRRYERIDAPENQGSADAMLAGIARIFADHDRVVALEDDLVTAPGFLDFVNRALDAYAAVPHVWSVTGYTPPIRIPRDYPHTVYLTPRASSWGWGTWRDRWERADWEVTDYNAFTADPARQAAFNRSGDDLTPMLVDQMEGRIETWDVRWCYAQFKAGAGTVRPIRSLVRNIGFDGTGRHCLKTFGAGRVKMDAGDVAYAFPPDLAEDPVIMRRFKRYYRPLQQRPTWILHRIRDKLARSFGHRR